jgi:NADH:ubiquinone oxidoreductase subunit 2 (subunit N)
VLLISLAGIPPLLGFWAKFGAFAAAFVSAASGFAGGQLLVAWVSVAVGAAGVIGSVVSLAYYGSVLRALYEPAAVVDAPTGAGESDENVEAEHVAGRSARIAVAVLAVVVTAVGLVPLVSGVDVLWRFFA